MRQERVHVDSHPEPAGLRLARYEPPAVWPHHARVAVSIVLNWVEGAADDRFDPADRYGSRAGVWRLQRLFDSFHIPITIFGTADAFERNPGLTEWIRAADHEAGCQGCQHGDPVELSKDEEGERLLAAVASIARTCGARPRGWRSARGPSSYTRELLVAEGGFAYDSDAADDDLPYFTDVDGSRHLVVPYTTEYDDSRHLRSDGRSDPAAFFAHCRQALDYLWDEGLTHPRMLSIGLDSRWAGQPAHAAALRDFIECGLESGHVWFARRVDIGDWWRANEGRFDTAA